MIDQHNIMNLTESSAMALAFNAAPWYQAAHKRKILTQLLRKFIVISLEMKMKTNSIEETRRLGQAYEALPKDCRSGFAAVRRCTAHHQHRIAILYVTNRACHGTLTNSQIE